MAKKKKINRSKITVVLFWLCLFLVIAPIAVFGYILVSSAMDTGTPIFGDRYKGDLDPAITEAQMEEIKTGTAAIEGVDSAELTMASATLRVYADITDDADADKAKELANTVYEYVTSVLDPNTYFSQYDGKKMYDLEVHVFNTRDYESETFVYVIKNLNSSMTEGPHTQLVSEPLYPELAERLRKETEERQAAEEAERKAAEEAENAENSGEGSSGEGSSAEGSEGAEGSEQSGEETGTEGN